MEYEHDDYGLEQEKDYILLKERSRVDRELWLKLTQSLKDMDGDYDPGIAIREVNHFVKMRDLNHAIYDNKGTSLGIGLYGNDSFTCDIHEVRCMVPDAWPMYRESTMEEFLEAEDDYRRACEGDPEDEMEQLSDMDVSAEQEMDELNRNHPKK